VRLLGAETDQVMAEADSRLLPSRSDYAHAHGRAGGLRAINLAAQAILDRARLRFEQQQAKHEGGRDRSPVEV